MCAVKKSAPTAFALKVEKLSGLMLPWIEASLFHELLDTSQKPSDLI